MPTQLQEHALQLEPAPSQSVSQGSRERLRIMHVLACLGNGGTEFGVLKLIKGLGTEQFENRICITRQADSEFVRAHGLEGGLASAAGSGARYQFPLFRLRKIFQQYRPHIVHTRNWGGLEAVLAARLARVPVVIHSEHGYEVGNLAGVPLRQKAFRRVAFAMTDRVFTVTQELCKYHARQAWTNPRRIGVIHNGVDTALYAPSASARDRVRREFSLPPERLVLGSVGRLVPIKDYAALLKAAERLLQQKVDAHVLLVGSGPEFEQLSRCASESQLLKDRVTFVGASDRVSELLNAMDVFVLPSLGEGMSNTLLEAMATGLPLVATHVGGNLEVIGEEQSEWLFVPGDVRGLENRILRLANDSALRSHLGAACRARSLELFSLEQMIRSYHQLYSVAAAQHGIVCSHSGIARKVTEQTG